MNRLDPVTPGEILLEEFLKPMGISQYRLAKEIGVPAQRISEIVAALPLAPTETLAALKTLFERGLTDMNLLKTSVFLTPEGYEAEEANRG